MPTNKEIASEIWRHVNSPEMLDKLVGDRINKLRREARFDELAEFQHERKEIDTAVEQYLDSPVFEEYKQAFLDSTDEYSLALQQAVAEMASRLRNEISESERERFGDQITSDLSSLEQAMEQEVSHDEPQH